MIESLSAVTLATQDMAHAVRFYRRLGFEMLYGGENAAFTSFRAGPNFLNLIAAPSDPSTRAHGPRAWWGRIIFYVSDVDAFYERVAASGFSPQAPPRDAPWGERFFHLTDPDGNELSFARRLRRREL